ncbi:MAG: GNAT family N-acetyltransferase [Bacteroidetes bacterium]|nr:GNAT family N-acetyltransferase [Bacteroidota bacterium]MCL5026539.1 GNAT family N-acetyltransferase [Chloroflexota bacterium]
MDVREFTMDDYDRVLQLLWQVRMMQVGNRSSRESIRKKLERDPDLFLVAENNGVILGVAMGSWDGHRAWIYLVEVDQACRGQGIGTRLAEELESRIRQKGASEICLLVSRDELQAQDFFQGRGFTVAADEINMTKSLI